MLKYGYCLLFICCASIISSCSSKNEDESEQIFRDYQAFVAEVENDTVVTEIDLGNTWKMDTDTLQMLYDKYKNSISEHMSSYTPERQEEVNAFDDRLDVAFEERQKRYDEVSHRYELRKKLLGIEVSEDDLSNSINPSNIVATYENFVTTLEDNLDELDTRDWQLIEGWWSALRNRKQTIESELQPAARERISELEQTYKQIRSETLAAGEA